MYLPQCKHTASKIQTSKKCHTQHTTSLIQNYFYLPPAGQNLLQQMQLIPVQGVEVDESIDKEGQYGNSGPVNIIINCTWQAIHPISSLYSQYIYINISNHEINSVKCHTMPRVIATNLQFYKKNGA